MISNRMSSSDWKTLGVVAVVALSSTVSFPDAAQAAEIRVNLAADQEVPPAKSAGAGMGTIMVNLDHTISGSITTTGITGTAAHIHQGAADKSGPVVIALVKNGESYSVPAGAKLTDAQYASFESGQLYINVHTAANPDGDIRGQLKP